MASSGPNFGSTTSQEIFCGFGWSNPSNVFAADGVNATGGASDVACQSTDYLLVTGFGFSIPAGATINGLVVTTTCSATGPNGALGKLYLVNAGVRQATKNKTMGGTTYTNATFGSSSDTWGESLTPSYINNSGFGIAINGITVNWKSGSSGFNLDYIKVTVYYTDAGGGGFAHSQSAIIG